MWKNNSVSYIYQQRDVYYFSRRVLKDLEGYYRASNRSRGGQVRSCVAHVIRGGVKCC